MFGTVAGVPETPRPQRDGRATAQEHDDNDRGIEAKLVRSGVGPRVLGVDPGLTRCGVGIVEGPVSRPRAVHLDCVRTPPDLPVHERLHRLHAAITAIVSTHRPTVIAFEQVLFSVNVRTAMATGQAAGVVLLAGAQAGVDVVGYTPTEVKLTVAGSGSAAKDAIARMVVAQLDLERAPGTVDTTDALAVAITHLARARLAGAAAGTTAAAELDRAQTAAARARRGGWEAVLGDRIDQARTPSTNAATTTGRQPVRGPVRRTS